jgi:serine/threonine protein kinase
MGQVYRAGDTTLRRDVAVKALPPTFAEDAGRMQRFEREAQLLASLNHPNIAAIYGVEQGAIVMELVEGAELRRPVHLEDGDLLCAADSRGTVGGPRKGHRASRSQAREYQGHCRRHGQAARFWATEATPSAAAATQSPTVSLAMTKAGMILGTAAYMSPEQARGQAVDKRADIWSFGTVLYELVTGTRLFEGQDVTDTIASVLRQEIDLSPVPARFRRLLRLCLERDPLLRLHDIGDARLLLDESEGPALSPARRTGLLWMVAGLSLSAFAGGLPNCVLPGFRFPNRTS